MPANFPTDLSFLKGKQTNQYDRIVQMKCSNLAVVFTVSHLINPCRKVYESLAEN
jgi:hypothetical protein